MITKTDKGNTLIRLYKNDYKKKSTTSSAIKISTRQQTTLPTDCNETLGTQATNARTVNDITNSLQRDIRNTVNECQNSKRHYQQIATRR